MRFNSYNKFVYKQYLLSPEWKKLQLKTLDRANHKCEKCGSKDNLQCYHKNLKNLYRESLDDLIILCKSCKKRYLVSYQLMNT